ELGISHVPEGRKLFPLLSVLENLKLGSYCKSARKHRGETLEKVFDVFPSLRQRKHQLAGNLSGGEQQMVAIGRGLMARPRLLLLDEPSLGLAPRLVKEIFLVVERIRSDGVAVLLVEQNIEQALRVADRAYVLETGRIVMEGGAQELLRSAKLRDAYLGVA
ncbi:MAG: ATP-binding cassette domain-containing protein, partial [Chloroflexota bacterium]|nr:ATP-binding cassette domain-containing protein [Chloroflexota bacterium]